MVIKFSKSECTESTEIISVLYQKSWPSSKTGACMVLDFWHLCISRWFNQINGEWSAWWHMFFSCYTYRIIFSDRESYSMLYMQYFKFIVNNLTIITGIKYVCSLIKRWAYLYQSKHVHCVLSNTRRYETMCMVVLLILYLHKTIMKALEIKLCENFTARLWRFFTVENSWMYSLL